ncbi:alpha-amylase family glycosyl hydrolase [Aliivibrio sp. S4TY2]|uniref:alpha-amylase family glycosyl hydrolase n=1 Tax=unclassified Aliivibrio TaxID=2645654 RepID=UPI002378C009|nr:MULTISPECIES: alpha-amylase family glycosyl hydrolase [unclassified Aliivibrio]MDD9155815.1 alpha-amylase family glycosyl hydrolase [Aliivibrio sp. S4TY2]MDD9159505.1 alpha-amylase family glycosyl hydrolase [Aliivibrio sp. S4TY1]MDD9163523.1 alpha-amylase family glycosyl hydrolase [Aliivibrio sp. S4MY2]MDD9167524.1 alpha-amylase family glycosyl hydrolase [Aliivibrio sp. S4MY4]MDD9186048.1 alpha-amylase family glycosyl hydrolase [Aliivibrio sp. S4MY3]
MKNNIAKTAIALAITSLLSACSSTSETTQTTSAYQCNPQMMEKSNHLRIYQIMVESFVNGDSSVGHGTGYGPSHHNGDLQGIIDSLDYIQSLGMNAIWMTPIFESAPIEGQDHWADKLDATGYFATDFFKIDPRFGTLEKAKELVEEAHKRGMYVLFDGVFGHHKEGLIKPSPSGLLPSGSNNPVDYPESEDFYSEVAAYWISELKIDGWRLDQAYQVPTESWINIRKAVDNASQNTTYINNKGEQVNPLGYMVAEIWNNESYITETGYGTEQNPALCSAFDFPLRFRVAETFAVNESSVGNKGGDWLNEGMQMHELYPSHATPNLMLGNHDVVRFGDLLQRGDIAEPSDRNYWLRHKAALSFQAAYTGPITLYYGDEIGDQVDDFSNKENKDTCAIKGVCDDHIARSSAKIHGLTATLTPDQLNLKTYVSELMTLRIENPALSEGVRTNIIANKAVYVDHKQAENNTILFMVSTQKQNQTLSLKAEQIGSKGNLVDLLTNQVFTPIEGIYTIPLSNFESRFLKIEKPNPTGPKVEAKEITLYGTGFMAQCDNPTMPITNAPIKDTLYLVGDFSDSRWGHKEPRSYQYKGNGIYQVVINEKRGPYKMQYATKDWGAQYTVDGLSPKLGQSNALINGGYGQDTAIYLPEDGNYVWSLEFNPQGKPKSMMVSKCK